MRGSTPWWKWAWHLGVGALWVALAVVAVALAVPANRMDLLRLQLAGSYRRADAIVAGPQRDRALELARAASRDELAMVAVAVVAVAVPLVIACVAGTLGTRRRRPPWTAILAGIGLAAAAGAVASAVLARWQISRGLDALAAGAPHDARFVLASVSSGLALASYLAAAAIAAIVYVTWVHVTCALGSHVPILHDPAARPSGVDWEPGPRRVGISCSGGGVRSASFSLGALQELDDAGVLAGASYVTAVSGGGYTAAAWAIAAGEWREGHPRGPAPSPPLFAPRSPEERWVRLHSSHLIGSPLVFVQGALRLVAGVLFGWFLIWLLMFAVAQPVGWVISSEHVHPELRARTPIVETVAQPSYRGSEVRFVGNFADVDPPYALYSFVPRYTCAVVRTWADVTNGRERLEPAALAVTSPGLVRIEGKEVTIAVEPELEVVNAPAGADVGVLPGGASDERASDCTTVAGAVPFEPAASPSANAEGPTLVIASAPTFDVSRAVITSADPNQVATILRDALEEDRAATITHRSGMTGRQHITFEPWQWLAGIVLLAIGLVTFLASVLWRPFRPTLRRTLRIGGAVAASTGAAWLVVLVVLPWTVQEVPPFLSDLLHLDAHAGAAADGASGVETVLALLGVTGLLATAVRAFGEFAVKQGRAHLGIVTKAAAGILLPLVGVLVLIDLLEFSTANGPRGRFLGLGVGMQLAGTVAAASWVRWLVVLGILAVLATVDAHAWSMYPWYKRRLNGAFAVRRRADSTIEPVPYDDHPVLVAEHRTTRLSTTSPPHDALAPRSGGPQLVMCCAANVSSRHVAPPGRRAVSFSVSREAIGAPEIGWCDLATYQRWLNDRRRSDVTLPSLMAISGAAVSPGMGKMSKGPLDGLLALLNVRLGVWLPNPAAVGTPMRWWKPWWAWYLREVAGMFDPQAKLLYVSDGGHWENLGLVELFRRGCTEIYCISAAGDGPESFATIGEALALAREVVGVDVRIDLSSLRAEATCTSPRRLLRVAKGAKRDAPPEPVGWCPSPSVVGTFTYPATATRPDVEGRLLLVEANLATGMPWDVQTWAESSAAFPDDPTTDQLFDHRQFQSYLQLGRFQMRTGLRSDEWRCGGA